MRTPTTYTACPDRLSRPRVPRPADWSCDQIRHILASMDETDKQTRVRIGHKMREVWDYINKHPGELEYTIKIQFGRTGRVTERLEKANLIEIVENRCYVKNGLETAIKRSQSSRDQDLIRQYSFDLALQVPCLNRECLAPIATKCTGLTRYKRERIGPHYERLIALVAAQGKRRELMNASTNSDDLQQLSDQPLSDFLLMITKQQS